MAIDLCKRLSKGERIDLTKKDGSKLTNFCVECNWGDVIKKTFFGLIDSKVDVDLDLSCMLFDENGQAVDHIYSPLFRFGDNNVGLPNGKLDSRCRAIHHTGDELTGAGNGEVITVDLNRLNPAVAQIVFFLNIYNNNEYSGDFSGIPFASIKMYEGRPGKPKEIFAQYDVATREECAGMRGLILGKLYRRGSQWKFAAIGEAFPDQSIVHTIVRVIKDYNK